MDAGTIWIDARETGTVSRELTALEIYAAKSPPRPPSVRALPTPDARDAPPPAPDSETPPETTTGSRDADAVAASDVAPPPVASSTTHTCDVDAPPPDAPPACSDVAPAPPASTTFE